jgi:hypothetical protein
MADPISISASIVTLLQLSATVIKYLSGVKDAPNDRTRLMSEVGSINYILSTLQDLAQSGEKVRLDTIRLLNRADGPLYQLQYALTCLEKKLAPVGGWDNARNVLAWPFQKEEVKEFLSDIERQKTLISVALHNDQL